MHPLAVMSITVLHPIPPAHRCQLTCLFTNISSGHCGTEILGDWLLWLPDSQGCTSVQWCSCKSVPKFDEQEQYVYENFAQASRSTHLISAVHIGFELQDGLHQGWVAIASCHMQHTLPPLHSHILLDITDLASHNLDCSSSAATTQVAMPGGASGSCYMQHRMAPLYTHIFSDTSNIASCILECSSSAVPM